VQGSLKYVCRILDREFDSQGIFGLADLRLESSFVGFLKPRPKLTFGYDARLALSRWVELNIK
jgi:hypothetical protein